MVLVLKTKDSVLTIEVSVLVQMVVEEEAFVLKVVLVLKKEEVGVDLVLVQKWVVPLVLKLVGHFAVANFVTEVVALGWGVGRPNWTHSEQKMEASDLGLRH